MGGVHFQEKMDHWLCAHVEEAPINVVARSDVFGATKQSPLAVYT
jgi:hypothetical protein